MNVFALADVHFSFGTPTKSMAVFGDHWTDHPERIALNWREQVGPEDLVLVPGDISWAMKLDGAAPDLEFLGSLPGQKVLCRGNHDYWWTSRAKVRAALPAGIHIVHSDAIVVGDVVLAGTRLWDVPGVSLRDLIDWKPNPISLPPDPRSEEDGCTEEERARNQKIYDREVGRLRTALGAMDALDPDRTRLRVALIHYPPTDADLRTNELTRLFEAHGVRHVVFGHLHSVRTDLAAAPFGEKNGVTYHLTSCDYLDFRPVLIAER